MSSSNIDRYCEYSKLGRIYLTFPIDISHLLYSDVMIRAAYMLTIYKGHIISLDTSEHDINSTIPMPYWIKVTLL